MLVVPAGGVETRATTNVSSAELLQYSSRTAVKAAAGKKAC